MISDRQYGFLPGRSVEDATVELCRMVSRSEHRLITGIFFDISGAFDNVWWPKVLDNLRKRECPDNVFKVLTNYFEDSSVKITLGDIEVSKRPTRGCPQGSVLGPACWNIMFDELLRILEAEVPDNFIAYADDLMVLVEANSRRELETKARCVVNNIVEWCKSSKLRISEKKTVAIMLRNKTIKRAPIGRRGGTRPDRKRKTTKNNKIGNRLPILKISASKIPYEKSIKYLGVYYDEGMHARTHCKYLRDKVTKLFHKLSRVAREKWGLRFGALNVLYRGVFLPTVTYAAKGWYHLCTAQDLKVLRSMQRLALVTITKAYKTASLESLFVAARALPIDLLLEQSTARHNIRIGRNAKINNVEIEGNEKNAIEQTKTQIVEMWQAKWNSSYKGRTTYSFLNYSRERMTMKWIRPNHYCTQVLTGHGNFRARLASLGLAENDDCSYCGGTDTAKHLLTECPEFEPQRVALMDIIGNHEWPEAAHQLVATDEAFRVFTDFCKETLWIKGQDEFAREANRGYLEDNYD